MREASSLAVSAQVGDDGAGMGPRARPPPHCPLTLGLRHAGCAARSDSHPPQQALDGEASGLPPGPGRALSHLGAHFALVTLSVALTPFSGNKISHLMANSLAT